MRYTCILLLTVLMFSHPLSSFAETNDPEIIKTRAKGDADRDVSRLKWFGSGTGLMGGVMCCIATAGIAFHNTGNTNGNPPEAIFTFPFLIPVVGLAAIYRHSPSPPAERLIGKSPLYVSIYTDTYQSHARSIRTKMAASGCCLTYGVLGCLGFVAYILDPTL